MSVGLRGWDLRGVLGGGGGQPHGEEVRATLIWLKLARLVGLACVSSSSNDDAADGSVVRMMVSASSE